MKRFFILVALCLALAVAAVPCSADSSRRLPAAYNVSTFGSSGRDYTTLQAWEDATDNNLVAAAKGEVLDCYPDSASYNAAIIISGATTSSSYFRVVRAAPGYERQVNVYSASSNMTTQATFWVQESYAGIYDLCIQKNSPDLGLTSQGVTVVSSSGVKIVGCIIGPVYSASTISYAEGIGINYYNSNGYVANTVVKNITNGGTTQNSMCLSVAGSTSTSSTVYLYNCLLDTSRWGINTNTGYGGGYCYAKNVIGRNLTTTTYGSNITTTTCLLTTGAGSVSFEADGYHLSAADTVARDQGTDLSSDSYYAFSDDIDGSTRPMGAAWDIGPDEFYVAAPEPEPEPEPEPSISLRKGPWSLGPWNAGPWTGGGKLGRWN